MTLLVIKGFARYEFVQAEDFQGQLCAAAKFIVDEDCMRQDAFKNSEDHRLHTTKINAKINKGVNTAKKASMETKTAVTLAILGTAVTDFGQTNAVTKKFHSVKKSLKQSNPNTYKTNAIYLHYAALHTIEALANHLVANSINQSPQQLDQSRLETYFANLTVLTGIENERFMELFGMAQEAYGMEPELINAADIFIKKLDPRTNIFATSQIAGSNIHKGIGHYRYPAGIMALGTAGIAPRTAQNDVFSIVAEIVKDSYLVVMNPESREPALLPVYMEAAHDVDPKMEHSGHIDVRFSSLNNQVQLNDRHIEWNTKKPARSGILTLSTPSKDPTYSFFASVNEKRFRYWCPTRTQINKLKHFAKLERPDGFSLEELFSFIKKDDFGIDHQILEELTTIL